jgi:hypothetical protein
MRIVQRDGPYCRQKPDGSATASIGTALYFIFVFDRWRSRRSILIPESRQSSAATSCVTHRAKKCQRAGTEWKRRSNIWSSLVPATVTLYKTFDGGSRLFDATRARSTHSQSFDRYDVDVDWSLYRPYAMFIITYRHEINCLASRSASGFEQRRTSVHLVCRSQSASRPLCPLTAAPRDHDTTAHTDRRCANSRNPSPAAGTFGSTGFWTRIGQGTPRGRRRDLQRPLS